jgi:hypothetical protein
MTTERGGLMGDSSDDDESVEVGSDETYEQPETEADDSFEVPEEEQVPRKADRKRKRDAQSDENEDTQAPPQQQDGHDDEGQRPAKRRRAASTPKAPALPSLGTSLVGQGTEGPCGSFMRERQLIVRNAAASAKGFVIQKVTRAFAVEVWNAVSAAWEPCADAALDAYVNSGDPAYQSQAYATCTTYWELWTVKGDRIIDGKDRFTLCSIIPPSGVQVNTSRGTFVITGEAWLYVTDRNINPLDPNGLGFVKDNPAAPAAGGLPSTIIDPVGTLTALGLAQSGPSVWFQVIVTWDSAAPDTVSTVEMLTRAD